MLDVVHGGFTRHARLPDRRGTAARGCDRTRLPGRRVGFSLPAWSVARRDTRRRGCVTERRGILKRRQQSAAKAPFGKVADLPTADGAQALVEHNRFLAPQLFHLLRQEQRTLLQAHALAGGACPARIEETPHGLRYGFHLYCREAELIGHLASI